MFSSIFSPFSSSIAALTTQKIRMFGIDDREDKNGRRRIKDVEVYVPIVYGSIAFYLGKKATEIFKEGLSFFRVRCFFVFAKQKFLKEVAAEFLFSIMLDEPADKIYVFYTTKTPQVMNVTYKAGSENFRENMFKKAVKNLPTVHKKMGSELTSDDLINILTYQPLYTMGDPHAMKEIILVTSAVPNLPSSVSRNILMAAKEKCVSFEFLLVDDHPSRAHENKETFLRTLSEIDNCSMRYWPNDSVSMKTYVQALLSKLNDASGDPGQI
ncbi:unnamed protein product, partial [Arabidopsis halleri]